MTTKGYFEDILNGKENVFAGLQPGVSNLFDIQYELVVCYFSILSLIYLHGWSPQTIPCCFLCILYAL